MKKTASALLTIFASAMLLSACADDEDMWGRHHDRDRDRDHHDEHFSQLQAPAAAPVGPGVAGR
ncbi:MAG: hypothetical protein JWO83_1800 [Caulobacteraceae bacterium]|nr:hypothetical protein [Caulobacteraceae bacterium]